MKRHSLSCSNIFIYFIILLLLNACVSHKVQNASQNPINYSSLANWAAHPAKYDPSDSIPAFAKNEKLDSDVDVFFIHPTTFLKLFSRQWNARIDDPELNQKTDKGAILFQASVFNGCGRIFAPRYRQAHLKAFFMRNRPEAKAALDFAYEDVKAAFQYYMAHWNKGRPIIIASHSQGSVHAVRLLQEFFDGKPLQKQLVCAYIVGYQIKKDAFKSIPVGTSPSQTGCFVGWRSFKKGASDSKRVSIENGNSICVNPVTWDTFSGKWSASELHKGVVLKNFNELRFPGIIRCSITPGTKILWVDIPDEDLGKYRHINNYHIVDYNLFYENIRKNVRQRVEKYLGR